MARKRFEIRNARRPNGALANGVDFAVYTDEAGTTLANISATSGGSPIAGSTVTTGDVAGLGPASSVFYGPTTDTDTLWAGSPTDPTLGLQRLEASLDDRVDALEAGIGDPAQVALLNTANTFIADQYFKSGRPWVDVRAFGAVGDGVADDTAAFEAAAAAVPDVATGKYGGLYVSRGIYNIHEVDLPAHTHLFSDSTVTARLNYNGAGGAGSYMLKWASCSYGGMEGFVVAGATVGQAAAAESLIVLNGVLDNQWIFRNNALQWCTGDAISFQGTGFINFHLERCRADGVGGYLLFINGDLSFESRPCTFTEFTYDNNISSSAIRTIMGYDGTHWGRGIVHTDIGNGIVVVFENSRIECNGRFIGDRDAALVYEDGATTGGLHVHFNNCYGYVPSGRLTPLVSTSAVGRARVHLSHSSIEAAGLLLDRTTGILYGRRSNALSAGGAGGSKQFTTGLSVGQNPVQVDALAIADVPNSFQRFQRGDWLLYPTSDVAPGSRGYARVMAYPASGWAVAASETISTTADVSATSDTVTGLTSTKELRDANVSIAGAGTAGAAHLCRITAYDPDTSTATITPAAVTTVADATVAFQAPVWRDVGGNHAAAAPVSGDWTRGEFVWNTTPADVSSPVADHVILGWQCVASGTPGTWVEVRALTENLSVGGSTPTDVQVFTTSGTWTKPTDALAVEVVLVGGGAGGGSGRRGAAGTVRTGGAGGAGAGVTRQLLPASACGATEAVSVGTGGAGGAAASADDTDGAVGTSGTASLFGSLLRATHGVFGGAGSTGSATGGTAGPGMFSGGAGQPSNATGGAGTGASAASAGAGGGGSGGGISAGDAVSNGGVGAALPNSQANQTGGGAAGTAGGAGGAGTSAVANTGSPGAGGGGGASSTTGVAGAGGAGGSYGGGGGGGGASLNGNASGAGGAGAPGIAIITSFF